MRWPESPDRPDSSRSSKPARSSRTATRNVAAAWFPLGLILALAATACGPRYTRVTIQDSGGLIVQLRAEVREGEAVDRGFAHPATISRARITNILSRIEVRLEDGEESGKEAAREPAIPAEFLYDLGDLVSAALAEAAPSQEVVVRAVRKSRHLGIFTEKFLTSFVTYVLGEDLYIHLSRVDDTLPEDPDDTIPEPWPNREVMPFKVLVSDGIVPIGTQAVVVAWRDPLFRAPGQVKVGPGGQILRRQILLESLPEETENATPETTGHLSPETLRALADLEELRRQGTISEAAYQERRRSLLASDPSTQ
jgi:hypothetical protein